MSVPTISPQQFHRINYCLEQIEKLTGWEQEFINSIAEYPVDRPLSSTEEAKLKEIYDKV